MAINKNARTENRIDPDKYTSKQEYWTFVMQKRMAWRSARNNGSTPSRARHPDTPSAVDSSGFGKQRFSRISPSSPVPAARSSRLTKRMSASLVPRAKETAVRNSAQLVAFVQRPSLKIAVTLPPAHGGVPPRELASAPTSVQLAWHKKRLQPLGLTNPENVQRLRQQPRRQKVGEDRGAGGESSSCWGKQGAALEEPRH